MSEGTTSTAATDPTWQRGGFAPVEVPATRGAGRSSGTSWVRSPAAERAPSSLLAPTHADDATPARALAPVPVGLIAKRVARIKRPPVRTGRTGGLRKSLDDALRLEIEHYLHRILSDLMRDGVLHAVHPRDGHAFDRDDPRDDASWPLWCLLESDRERAIELLLEVDVDSAPPVTAGESTPAPRTLRVDAPPPTGAATDATSSEQPVPDFALLSNRSRLLEAYGPWGLRKAWFRDLKSHEWLRDARVIVGISYRGSGVEPMFCPFRVMQGMLRQSSVRHALDERMAWSILEHNFALTYAAHRAEDPRQREATAATAEMKPTVEA